MQPVPLSLPSCYSRCVLATVVSRLGPERRQALTLFLATIENDDCEMKTLAAILIRALLTISTAALADQLLTSDKQTAQGVG
jgi:hypothetical protein